MSTVNRHFFALARPHHPVSNEGRPTRVSQWNGERINAATFVEVPPDARWGGGGVVGGGGQCHGATGDGRHKDGARQKFIDPARSVGCLQKNGVEGATNEPALV